MSGRTYEPVGAACAHAEPLSRLSIACRGADVTVPLDPSNPAAGAGPLTQRVFDELLRIQYGGVPGHPWTLRVP